MESRGRHTHPRPVSVCVCVAKREECMGVYLCKMFPEAFSDLAPRGRTGGGGKSARLKRGS
jgi:hypothetical protein